MENLDYNKEYLKLMVNYQPVPFIEEDVFDEYGNYKMLSIFSEEQLREEIYITNDFSDIINHEIL